MLELSDSNLKGTIISMLKYIIKHVPNEKSPKIFAGHTKHVNKKTKWKIFKLSSIISEIKNSLDVLKSRIEKAEESYQLVWR